MNFALKNYFKPQNKSFGFAWLGAMALALSLATAPEAALAQAPAETVSAIQLSQLQGYQGKYLTVLYAVATKPLVSVDDRQLNITEIKHAVGGIPIRSAQVELPAVSLPIQGFRPGYNFVVFVVHSQPKFAWQNANGTVPQNVHGVSVSPETAASLNVKAFSKDHIESLMQQPGGEVIILSL